MAIWEFLVGNCTHETEGGARTGVQKSNSAHPMARRFLLFRYNDAFPAPSAFHPEIPAGNGLHTNYDPFLLPGEPIPALKMLGKPTYITNTRPTTRQTAAYCTLLSPLLKLQGKPGPPVFCSGFGRGSPLLLREIGVHTPKYVHYTLRLRRR
jgi:hypothetical protein